MSIRVALRVAACVIVLSACAPMPGWESPPSAEEWAAHREEERQFRCATCVVLDSTPAERVADGVSSEVDTRVFGADEGTMTVRHVYLSATRKADGTLLISVQTIPFSALPTTTSRFYLLVVGDLDEHPTISWWPSDHASPGARNPTSFPIVEGPQVTGGSASGICDSTECGARIGPLKVLGDT